MHSLTSQDNVEPRYALLAGVWAVSTVTILIIIKLIAYIQSGSVAVLATLMDSVMDAGISVMMLLAVRLSLKPADSSHRHGHGKVEGLAALFQASVLFAGGMFLIFESLRRFISPEPVGDHALGIGVAAVAILLSFILVAVQNFTLKRAPSLAVESDRAHYTTDIAVNGSVIVALILDYYGGPAWVDPTAGVLIGLYFLYTAQHIGRKGTDMLMDRELPQAVRERIERIVLEHEDAHGIHDLRTRMSGMVMHISFDMEIDPEMSLRDAHQVSREIENAILADYPYAEVMIHKDPMGDTDDNRHTVKGVHH